MTERKRKNDREKFYYICGKFISGERCSIISTPKLQKAYSKDFNLSLIQDIGKVWAPSYACSSSNTNLLQWLSGKKKNCVCYSANLV